jgi:aspartate racemase
MSMAGGAGIGQKRVIGIVGGMGPRAHVLFEENLLTKAVDVLGAAKDADFPAWALVSFPGTPDRTRALRGRGESPLPAIKESLARLAGAGVDFAVAPCVTSHAFLAGEGLPLPVLSLPAVTARVAAAAGVRRAGILATSGTLAAGLFDRAFSEAGIGSVSPLDLPNGEAAQLNLVMTAIYGPGGGMADDTAGGIKGGGPTPETDALLLAAGKNLVAAGADALVMGCTEISFAAGRLARAGVRLVDPLAIAAEAAIRYAYGLPFAGAGAEGSEEIWEKCFL